MGSEIKVFKALLVVQDKGTNNPFILILKRKKNEDLI